MNGGIINSITKLHLVGISTELYCLCFNQCVKNSSWEGIVWALSGSKRLIFNEHNFEQ
jgi:hypothetical protein